MLRVLAIDPSLTRTGLAWNGTPHGSLAAPEVRSIKTANLRGWERVETILSTINTIINAFEPHLVAIETCLARSTNGPETIWLHGLIRREIEWIRRTPLVEIAPMTLKKWAVGNIPQSDRQKDTILLAAERAGLGPSNNDEADAAWMWHLATTGTITIRDESVLTVKRREVLHGIAWPHIPSLGHNQPNWPKPKPVKKPKKGSAA